MVAAAWLIIAPRVLGYSTSDPRWNDVAFGIVVAVLALIRMTGAHRSHALSLVNAMIGLWLAVTAFTTDHTSARRGTTSCSARSSTCWRSPAREQR